MTRCVVTGGAGFVGSHLVDALLQKGHDVLVVDNLSNGHNFNKNAVLARMDVNDSMNVIHTFRPSIIYHLACFPRSTSFDNPERDHETNYLSTLRICELAKTIRCRVVYSSNGGLMGEPKSLPMTEDHPVHPTTPYDLHKLASENILKLYGETFDVCSVVFRFGTIYGPRQRVNLEIGWEPLIPDYINRLTRNQPVYVYGESKATRDLVYVDDIVNALMLVLNKEMCGYNGPFLLGTEKEISVKWVQNYLRDHIESSSKTINRPRKIGEIDRLCFSYDRAKQALGWTPKVQIDVGLNKTLEWWRQELAKM